MNRDWYKGGLKFHCIGCGDCCCGEPGYVWANKAEIKAMAEALELEAEEFERQCVRAVGIRKSLTERPGGDCILLDADTRKCRVYDVRPRQCRTWPFWSSNLTSPAAWVEAAERCPGCNHGQRFSFEEIREILNPG